MVSSLEFAVLALITENAEVVDASRRALSPPDARER
jgi:hypothetical protein